MNRPTSQRPGPPPGESRSYRLETLVAGGIERVRPDYKEAFGRLAALATGAIASEDPDKRAEYLKRCEEVIEQVYSPTVRLP